VALASQKPEAETSSLLLRSFWRSHKPAKSGFTTIKSDKPRSRSGGAFLRNQLL